MGEDKPMPQEWGSACPRPSQPKPPLSNTSLSSPTYRDGLDIAERLTKSDPGNAGWQRDLSVSHMRIADVARKSGDATTARAEFAAAREISARLAALSPDNADWKADLAYIDEQLAGLGK